MSIKNLKFGILSLVASFGVLALGAGVAQAHYVYDAGYIHWTSSEDCVWGYSETSHGNGNGYSKSEMISRKAYNGSSCADLFSRPAGYLRTRQLFWAQLAPGWGVCRDTGTLYNTSNSSVMTTARTHGSKCGTTWYSTESRMHMLNGSWKGGNLNSTNHWL